MRNYHLSILLGVTSTITVGAPLSVQAATFNFDSLQYISTRPIESEDTLFFFGAPSDNQGFTGFFNQDPAAPDRGHTEISLNSPGNIAPYYTTGRENSPEEPPNGATRSATLDNITGFSNFFSYLTNNNILLSDIGFGYGQKSDRDFTATWNLGDDILGQDWFASPDSTLEERIYAANPDDVEIYLSYGTNNIVNFGYTPFYNALEYGSTPSSVDDSEAVLTETITANRVAELDPLAAGLADAFLLDVANAGGSIQVVIEDAQVPDLSFASGNGFNVASIPFPVSLRAVPSATVPEPSSVIGLFMFGALGAVSRLKKPNKERKLLS